MRNRKYEDSTYPTAVFCIIATEFCERFSFCGLRTILSIYLRNELLFSENASTVIYHVFIMVSYTIPIVGAICADSILGRYRTILYFSVIYLIGNILMCMGAIPFIEASSIVLSAVGLLLIAIGTGGIKPCVAAFGGDQFHLPDQTQLLRHFFSLFYFTINLGGFVGMILTPILRKWVTCFGQDTCYALGFGFPAALMLLALVLFMMGKNWYKVRTPKENIVENFVKCVVYALGEKWRDRGGPRRRHWLNRARHRFGVKLIEEMKRVLSVMFLYVPLPIFWSLFDQQGSRWTFQASHMNGNVLGMQIVPDQMQVVNPAMVLVLLPVFDKVINPYMEKVDVLDNPLNRMAIGGLFASLAFITAGALEVVLETTYPRNVEKKFASVNLINTLPCEITMYTPYEEVRNIASGEKSIYENIPCDNYTKFAVVLKMNSLCGGIFIEGTRHTLEIMALEKKVDTVIVGIDQRNQIQGYVFEPEDYQKSLSGKPRLKVSFIKGSPNLKNITVSLKNEQGLQDVYFVRDGSKATAESSYMELPQGVYECVISCQNHAHLHEETFNLAVGGVYSLVIRERNMKIECFRLYTMSAPNTINILWLLPQYFLITMAEILFGVAGLEFSFTQAPKSMKTVTIAAWYISVAVGNMIVIVVTQANFFSSQAREFFLFGVVMIADMMVFIQLASTYRFAAPQVDSSVCFLNEKESLLEEPVPY